MGDPCFTLAAGSEERAVVELPTGTVTFLFTDLDAPVGGAAGGNAGRAGASR